MSKDALEYDDQDLDLDLDSDDDTDQNSSDRPAGKQGSPGVYKALRGLGKAVRTLSDQVAQLQNGGRALANPPSDPQNPPVNPPAQPTNEMEDRVELRLQGFSHDEIAFIARNRQAGQSLLDAAKDPYVKSAIEGTRRQQEIEAATPPPSNTNGAPAPQIETRRDIAGNPKKAKALQEQLIQQNRAKRK